MAGYTALDVNASALEAVLAESNSSRDYVKRIANLSGTGSGLRSNDDYSMIAVGSAATFFDDNNCDELEGDAGRDWFFRRKKKNHRDDTNDQQANEFVTVT